MRTLNQNGGNGDRKPSKLEQMRVDYQKKLMREKEEKMVQMYEDSQRKAMMRLTRKGSAGTGDQMSSNGAKSPSGGKSVREFFNERRRLEAAGAPMPNIDHHYKQAKGYASPGGWSSRTGSGHSATKGSHLNKNSAGRDRAQPLAPIQRRPINATETVPDAGNNNNVYGQPHARSGIPLRQHNSQQPVVAQTGEENPFYSRPRLLKHKPLPPTTNGYDNGDAVETHRAVPTQPSSLPRYVHPPPNKRQQQQQQQQHQSPGRPQQQQPRQPHPPPGNKQGIPRATWKPRNTATKPTPVSNGNGGLDGTGSRTGSGKLTDFQKWQMEQNKAREDRLKKLNTTKPVQASNDGYWGQQDTHDDDDDNGYDDRNDHDSERYGSEDKENGQGPVINGLVTNKDRLSRLNGQRHAMDDNDDDEDDDDDDGGEEDIPEEDEDEMEEDEADDPIKAQERALMEQIAAKQREVERLRKEREQDEEEEKREMAMRKKREAAERARQKKLEEERRKEEERQRKLDEEEEKQERKRDEQRQRDEEKRRKEEEKRQREEDRRRQEEDRKATKRQAEEDRRLAKQQQKQQMSARTATYSDDDQQPTPRSHSRAQPIDDKPVAMAGSDAKFYMQAAASSEAKGSVGALAPCRQCGRKFAQDRLKKHQDACKKANKPRKEFDAAKKRVEGTELAQYSGKSKKLEPPKKKSNWRAQHEQFIESLRYAKKVTAYEKGGGDLKDLAPPPPSHNPDFVACPHCGRTFNETAAERHIPRCQSLKTRPPPMNTRKR